MLLAWLVGAFVVGAINAMLAFVVFMFTTVVGVVLLGIFAIIFIGNLLSPSEDEGGDDVNDRDL
jgi:predicted exporter